MTNDNTPKNGFKDVENKCATLIEILKPSEAAARECSFVIPASHGSIKNGCMDTNSQNKSKFRINVEYKHDNVTNHQGRYEVQYFVNDALDNKDSFCKSLKCYSDNNFMISTSDTCTHQDYQYKLEDPGGSTEAHHDPDTSQLNKDSFCKSFLWIVNQMVMFISNLCVPCGGCYFSDYQDNGELKLITLCNEFCASDD
jgi:hypothetical protein